MRVSVIQMAPTSDLGRNIAEADRLMRACIREDAPDIVCLPESWTCIGADPQETRARGQVFPRRGTNDAGGVAYEFLRGMAREQRIVVHGGSIGELDGDDLFNTTGVFGRDGRELARYRKIHLADIVWPNGDRNRESERYAAGTETVVYEAEGLRIGCAICYDLRFPELFFCLRRDGAELIFVPSIFPVQTGKDHWETLLRARAIETQCWVAAANVYGPYTRAGVTTHTYGHSLICNPWGHVVAKASDGVGWTTARIDPAVTSKVRTEIPLMQHRKLIAPVLGSSRGR